MAKRAPRPPRKPTIVHALPVWSAEDEPGWLVLLGRRSAPLGRFLHIIPDASWEPPVKSWFVPHDDFPEALRCLSLALDEKPFDLCVECVAANGRRRKPCVRWAKVPKCDYLPRDVFEDDRVSEAEIRANLLEVFALLDGATRKVADAARKAWQAARMSVPTSERAEAAELLGVELPCTREQLDAAFKKAAMRAHPDRGGSHEDMVRINRARAVLLDRQP